MTADEATLSRLAVLAQQGDKQAYAALLGAARQWLQRYFRRRVLPHDLDDLVHDTLVSLHRKLASYEPERAFMPWLAVIARYRFVDHLRLVYRRAEDQGIDTDIAIESEEESNGAPVMILLDWSITPSRANFGGRMPCTDDARARSSAWSKAVPSFCRRAM